MGFLQRVSSVAAPARLRAMTSAEYNQAFFSGSEMPSAWGTALSASGITVTPELAMTLTALYCGVSTIAYDLATLPLQVFKNRDDGGKDRVRGGSFTAGTGGIGSLVYLLRWQPNSWQTATEYFVGQIAQYLLRGKAYAEIVSGPSGFLEQLLPRHPDRVTEERLPSGRIRFKLLESGGRPRYLTQDEMHVVRDLSLDGGITSASRISYGGNAIGTAIAARNAQAKFFKSGMTSALLATYTGEKDDEDEEALHKSIARYATGVENSFGLALVPDDVKITNLGIEPDKAQMMLAQEWGVREVARLLRMPGHKLGIKDDTGYKSQVQAETEYVVGCVRPIGVTFEQAIQRDLILAKDRYFSEFQLAALLRGDPQQQAEFIEKMIQNRVMRPSEARLIINLNPDPALDKLSETDNQGGAPSKNQKTQSPRPQDANAETTYSRASLRGIFAIRDNAVRCLRRERAAVEKLAKKHASDVEGWQAGLREFYGDHAGFIAQTMRLPIDLARGYAAQHGSEFEVKGLVLIDGEAGAAWEAFEADELAALALDGVAA